MTDIATALEEILMKIGMITENYDSYRNSGGYDNYQKSSTSNRIFGLNTFSKPTNYFNRNENFNSSNNFSSRKNGWTNLDSAENSIGSEDKEDDNLIPDKNDATAN